MTVSNGVRRHVPVAIAERDAGVEVLRILDTVMITDVVWGTPSSENANAVTVTLTPLGPNGKPWLESTDTTLIGILLCSTGAIALTSNLSVDAGTIEVLVANVMALLTFTPAALAATDGVITVTITSTNAGVAEVTAMVPGGKAKAVSKTFV